MILHQCQNCGTFFDEGQLNPVTDLSQRVAPGEPMPSGECPEADCRAVCHPVEMDLKAVARLAVERLDGDVFFDPGNDEEEASLRYVRQAIDWLRKAVG